ncbi:MAG: homogentisate 1,2-dioxygenase [Deltaproteobacteria bacterium]|nr:MAG: homogentisate 1,2-dioxygenase [Deltaproteobacteria bacterium]
MYYKRGVTTRQAHVDIPAGTVEEEYAREGFSGRASHLYRREAPVLWSDIEGDLRPHALRLAELPGLGSADYLAGRVPVLRNADAELSMARVVREMDYDFRNADGDETLFVHGGSGRIETTFGPLRYAPGDYLVIPRGTDYRLVPVQDTTLLIVETAGEVSIPDRGLLGHHALFDPDVITVPEPRARERDGDGGRWRLKVKRQGRITTVTYPHDPMNVVGWKGDLTVWQLNVRDIRPVSSDRYHLPPTAHATFVAQNVVIATFLPRPLENGDPGALKVPFYHANTDYDEVLFYHDGDFFSREGIDAGMMTFHPQGLPHGPHPKAVDAVRTKTRTEEQAVMIDTRFPLELTESGRAVSLPDYWSSWSR